MFHCIHIPVAISACGVPTSCCKEEFRINSQCGYGVRSESESSRIANVNNVGCIVAIENLFNNELNIFIGCLVALFLVEIVVIVIALWLLVDREKKKNLRVINHTNLEDSRNNGNSKVRESDWEVHSL